jgi:hypothetical protein
VNFEAGGAWFRGIQVIPVCHSGLAPQDLPAPFNFLEVVELARPEGLAKLFDAVARVLDVRTPAIDFSSLAAEMREVEDRYVGSRPGTATIRDPKVLCAASEQYARPEYGFDVDAGVVASTFGPAVVVERALTGKRLLELFTSERFDIVHLVLAIHPETGDLIFDEIDRNSQPVSPNADRMTSRNFLELLRETQARLVVLATCFAIQLALDVQLAANLAAGTREIGGQEAAAWSECFYGLLSRGRSVHRAFDLTAQQLGTAIRPIYRDDVVFVLPSGVDP